MSRAESTDPSRPRLAGHEHTRLHEKTVVHIHDLRAAEAKLSELRTATGSCVAQCLAVPLLREGNGHRNNHHPPLTVVNRLPNSQIELVETFADQAVIAIENVRLFQELTEALEQQTATSEILGVIARSPTDIQPVLDTIAESAARVCNANDAAIRLAEGNMLRLAAHHGPIPMLAASELPIDRDSVVGRAVVDRQRIHIDDLLSVARQSFPDTGSAPSKKVLEPFWPCR